MKKEKLQILDSIYLEMNVAYNSSNDSKMKKLFNQFVLNYPEYIQQMHYNIISVFNEHNERPYFSCPIDIMSGYLLRYNIKGCLKTIESMFIVNNYQTISSQCIQTLYFPKVPFSPSDILYERQMPNDESVITETLRVSDLLSVIKYSTQVLEIIHPAKRTSAINDTITGLQSIELALNNKPQDKPINKSVHIINSVLSSIVKHTLENDSDKQKVATMSILIDLAIEFFVKK